MLISANPANRVPESLALDQAPCSVCGSTERWEDADIWRCRACCPTSLTQRSPHLDRLPAAPVQVLDAPLDAPRRPPKSLCPHLWQQDGPWVRCPQCGASHPGTTKGQ